MNNKSFLDINFKKEYRTARENIVTSFYIPVLSCAKNYKRAVGYFSSSSLVEISQGISGLISNHGRMMLVASPSLSQEDIDAIDKGYEKRKIILKALCRELNDYENTEKIDRLDFLANLISDGFLDIKIAVINNNNNIGIYHEKMGIIEDVDGNKLAFSGSMNETESAISFNYESIDVFCEWQGSDSKERVKAKCEAFKHIWTNTEPGLEVKEFPELNKEIIEKYKKTDFIISFENTKKHDEAAISKQVSVNRNPIGARIPESIQLREYQEEAITAWINNNACGIFDMATGTGKTLTALGAIATLSENANDYLSVIICCPLQHLVEQWVEDIVKFNIKPIICYSASKQKDWKKRLEKAIRDQKIRKDKSFFCAVTTNATFSSDYFQLQINKIKAPILLIADEAHNFGADRILSLLNEKYKYRLALSATIDRHRDIDGTKGLYEFFGKKCIEYDLERAIREDKLTPYRYYIVLNYLTESEMNDYDSISFQMVKHITTDRFGNKKLDSVGELLAIKRSKIIAAAKMKIEKLKEVIVPYKNSNFMLIYCGATSIRQGDELIDVGLDDDLRQIDLVTKILGNELNMKVAKFTSHETIEERNIIQEHFKNGEDLQGIVAIKCLDEGVNIPGIKTAFILASTTNPKEYIQRRGRVLRKFPGKEFAEIYDFVTLPRPMDEVPGLTEDQMKRDLGLVKNELRRVMEFADLAQNKVEAYEKIWNICDAYDLPYNLNEKGVGNDGE